MHMRLSLCSNGRGALYISVDMVLRRRWSPTVGRFAKLMTTSHLLKSSCAVSGFGSTTHACDFLLKEGTTVEKVECSVKLVKSLPTVCL